MEQFLQEECVILLTYIYYCSLTIAHLLLILLGSKSKKGVMGLFLFIVHWSSSKSHFALKTWVVLQDNHNLEASFNVQFLQFSDGWGCFNWTPGEVTPLSSWKPCATEKNLHFTKRITKISQFFFHFFSRVDIHSIYYIVKICNRFQRFCFYIKHTVSN
jgi:hypothetical protein